MKKESEFISIPTRLSSINNTYLNKLEFATNLGCAAYPIPVGAALDHWISINQAGSSIHLNRAARWSLTVVNTTDW